MNFEQENNYKDEIKKKRNYKHLLINIALLLIVLIIFFSMFEIILRLTEPKSKYNVRQNEFIFYEYNETLGWKNKPNASGLFYIPDSESYVKINSKGLRDKEYNYTKKTSVKRIEFYGDSFTWGYGVNAEDRYINIFGQELEKNSSGKFEVINLGVTGYGTDQEYLLMKEEGLKYKPNIIIFAYHNDASDVSKKITYTYPKPFFVLENGILKLTNVPVPKRDVNWSERETGFDNEESTAVIIDKKLEFFKSYQFFREMLLSFKFISQIKESVTIKNMNATFAVIDSLLMDSDKIAQSKNITFVLLLIPDKNQVYGKGDAIEINHVLDFGKKENITVINLLPYLKEIGKTEKDLYFETDYHFTKKGNEIVGELIFKLLKEKGII